MEHNLWSIVLAAGKGRRLSPLTGGVPKQFWRPAGASSLLDETLSRLSPLCPSSRTVIVVDRGHRRYVSARSSYKNRGQVVFQPSDRGTAAGVLLGLLPVLVADPDATILLTPSDHGIEHETIFRRGILEAVGHAQSVGGVVLLGVAPTTPRDDYGWISVGPVARPDGIRPVEAFVEKPHAAKARWLLMSGAVWNTMVMVAQVKDLVALFRMHLPNMTATFLQAVAMPASVRREYLAALYPTLPALNFSRDVLAPARGLLTYTWPSSMGWSDLGTPERLTEWRRTTTPAVANAGVEASV
ncbi:MAG: sugar phosphate nucleotidyltransferase [bacterium]